MLTRLATLADLTSLRLLWEALCEEQGASYPTLTPNDKRNWTGNMAMLLERQMAGERGVCIAIAFDDTEELMPPVGFLSCRLEERAIGSPRRYAIADHFYMAPSHRGERRGNALLAYGCQWLDQLNVTDIECVAIAGDAQWLQRGFTPFATRFTCSIPHFLAWVQNRIPSQENEKARYH